jgi:uncharacterized membrane protein
MLGVGCWVLGGVECRMLAIVCCMLGVAHKQKDVHSEGREVQERRNTRRHKVRVTEKHIFAMILVAKIHQTCKQQQHFVVTLSLRSRGVV